MHAGAHIFINIMHVNNSIKRSCISSTFATITIIQSIQLNKINIYKQNYILRQTKNVFFLYFGCTLRFYFQFRRTKLCKNKNVLCKLCVRFFFGTEKKMRDISHNNLLDSINILRHKSLDFSIKKNSQIGKNLFFSIRST